MPAAGRQTGFPSTSHDRPLAEGANQGQMAQPRTNHRNPQQAILSESAQVAAVHARSMRADSRPRPRALFASSITAKLRPPPCRFRLAWTSWPVALCHRLSFVRIRKDRGEVEPSRLVPSAKRADQRAERDGRHGKLRYYSPNPFRYPALTYVQFERSISIISLAVDLPHFTHPRSATAKGAHQALPPRSPQETRNVQQSPKSSKPRSKALRDL